ncbi:MAG: AAA family ATPase, partial [Candidatus Hydrogenedentes bacterium]|nr:AAA family ATPase [Candidatus Hydrogenedentota bacterium]
MHLLELTCDRFRCLNGLRFTPGRGLNVIRGENAQGKTSILEALLFAATTKSHRTATETDLVQCGESSFR